MGDIILYIVSVVLGVALLFCLYMIFIKIPLRLKRNNDVYKFRV